jgi:hypothetical protein
MPAVRLTRASRDQIRTQTNEPKLTSIEEAIARDKSVHPLGPLGVFANPSGAGKGGIGERSGVDHCYHPGCAVQFPSERATDWAHLCEDRPK